MRGFVGKSHVSAYETRWIRPMEHHWQQPPRRPPPCGPCGNRCTHSRKEFGIDALAAKGDANRWVPDTSALESNYWGPRGPSGPCGRPQLHGQSALEDASGPGGPGGSRDPGATRCRAHADTRACSHGRAAEAVGPACPSTQQHVPSTRRQRATLVGRAGRQDQRGRSMRPGGTVGPAIL